MAFFDIRIYSAILDFCSVFYLLIDRYSGYVHFYPAFGEGNGNPLQYSCLENPGDRGAWWAAVRGVAQSRTRLKWLSMHACIGEGNGNPLQYSCLENPRDRGASRLPSMGSHRVGHDWSDLAAAVAACTFSWASTQKRSFPKKHQLAFIIMNHGKPQQAKSVWHV